MDNVTATLFPTGSEATARRGNFFRPGPVIFLAAGDNVSVSTSSATFHEVYARYAEAVYRFALWLTGNPDEARDITSETFIRAFTGPNEIRLESVRAYLFAIARNLHRRQWRRASRNEPLDAEMPDPTTGPDEIAAQRDEFQRTLAAVQSLPELDRTVLLLRAEEGLSYDDIAAVTGLSATAARVKVFRARAQLTALLKTETGKLS